MFNLLISSNPESWNSSPYELERSRVAVEYTADEISERYKFFDEKAIQELKSFPTLFVIENETVESRIGYITNIRLRQNTVVIDFEFDSILPSLKIGAIEDLRIDIDLGKWELSRTHWAIKDESIFEILVHKGYISQQQLDASLALKFPPAPVIAPVHVEPGKFNTSQVFIVHGEADQAMALAESMKAENFNNVAVPVRAASCILSRPPRRTSRKTEMSISQAGKQVMFMAHSGTPPMA